MVWRFVWFGIGKPFDQHPKRLARINPKPLAFVDHRDKADNTTITPIPIPREKRECATFARNSVQITADILDPHNAVLEHYLMDRLPIGEIDLPITATGPNFIFLLQMRQ